MLRDTILLNVEGSGSGFYRSHGPTLIIGVGSIPVISVFLFCGASLSEIYISFPTRLYINCACSACLCVVVGGLPLLR